MEMINEKIGTRFLRNEKKRIQHEVNAEFSHVEELNSYLAIEKQIIQFVESPPF